MSNNKEKLEQFFLKLKEDLILIKIEEGYNTKIFLSKILDDEKFYKEGLLEVFQLSIKYNKEFVFQETWKRIKDIKNENIKKELYKDIIKDLFLNSYNENLFKIAANKSVITLKEIGFEIFNDAMIKNKESYVIYFIDKRKIKKNNDFIYNELIDIGFINKKYTFLNYLKKQGMDLLFDDNKYLRISNKIGDIQNIEYIQSINNKIVLELLKSNECHPNIKQWSDKVEFEKYLNKNIKKNNENKIKKL